MKKDIIGRYITSMDKKQFMDDMNEASRELSAFVSSFDYTDLPVAIFLMRGYCDNIIATNDEMQKAVDAISGLFGNVLVTAPVKKEGGTGDGV